MTEIEEVIAVAVDGENPGMRMVFGSKFFSKLPDGQCLSTNIDTGIVEEQFIHHFLGNQVVHLGRGFHQQAVNAKPFEDIQCHLGIRRGIPSTDDQDFVRILLHVCNQFFRDFFHG